MPHSVSIIVPCYNEEKTVRKLLDALHAQSYPRANMEVIIADGMSADGTRAEIERFGREHPALRVQVVDNPRRIIPAALNLALKAARGEMIIRLDAHSIPHREYVERCVDDLEQGLGMNVGGIWEIRPGAETWMGRAIAAAASHRLGVGDALYRHADKPATVDTVPFGAFKREVLALVGFFDESLLSNEDYEFNARIRQRGGKVWLDPGIRSVYIARSTLLELARQYWRYGFWKFQMLRRYPRTLRWRQALPPLFAGSLLLLGGLGFVWEGFHWMLAVEVGIYLGVLLTAGAAAAWKRRQWSLLVGLPAAIATMHLSWGGGFLWSIIGGWHIKRG